MRQQQQTMEEQEKEIIRLKEMMRKATEESSQKKSEEGLNVSAKKSARKARGRKRNASSQSGRKTRKSRRNKKSETDAAVITEQHDNQDSTRISNAKKKAREALRARRERSVAERLCLSFSIVFPLDKTYVPVFYNAPIVEPQGRRTKRRPTTAIKLKMQRE